MFTQHLMASLSRCLLISFSWALARSPDFVGAGLCSTLGVLTYTFSSRRHDILSALDHAFPEKDMAWKHRICRLHCTRMFEMFLIVLAMRHWSPKEMKERLKFTPSYSAFFDGPAKDRPSVLLLTHASTTEAMAVLPVTGAGFPKTMALYRALDNPAAETFVKESREFAGNSLYARREGLLKAKKALQSGRNAVAILFDQSAGHSGHLSLLFDRLCTTSNLASMLTAKTNAISAILYVRRDGFWRGTMSVRQLPDTNEPDRLLRAANAELESILRESDSQCADWFWAHKRWKATIRNESILNLKVLKTYLPQELEARGLDSPPRTTRIALRLDPRLELIPFAQTVADFIRHQRPDAQVWLLAPSTLPKDRLPAHDEMFTLPSEAKERKGVLKAINAERFPDALISLDPNLDAVSEAKLFQCDFRGGFAYSAPAKRSFHAHLVINSEAYLKSPYSAMIDFLEKLGISRSDTEIHFLAPPPLA